MCVAVVSLAVAGARSQPAQPKPYKVVFDLTSPDPANQQSVLRWIKEISEVNPGTEMEVVMYGRGLDLVVAAKTPLQRDVEAALATPHTSFRVCAIAMRSQKLEPNQLLPGVGIVPDGIGEIVAKQRAGWGYIKAAR
jgi:intracellular sulfur oxidation DsrE/DsrF family protein